MQPTTNTSEPRRPSFTNLGKAVVCKAGRYGTQVVARCVSNTYARRIAKALNCYEPGPKGY